MAAIVEHRVAANGIEITSPSSRRDAGAAAAAAGWPHAWMIWRDVMPILTASGRRAIAPDLRRLGASTHAAGGYDLHTLADDMAALFTALDEGPTLVASLDLGAPVAFMLAMRHSAKVRGSACRRH